MLNPPLWPKILDFDAIVSDTALLLGLCPYFDILVLFVLGGHSHLTIFVFVQDSDDLEVDDCLHVEQKLQTYSSI